MAQKTLTQSTWDKAVREIRKHGISIHQNVQECCNGCITLEKLGLEEASTEPWAYTFGGQDQATRWVDDKMVYRHTPRYAAGHKLSKVYFRHGNGSAELVAAVFTQYGFPVEWDGTDGKCVEVTPVLTK